MLTPLLSDRMLFAGRITLRDGYTWPSAELWPSTPIEIEFVCGYGDDSSSVPDSLKHAIKIHVSESFENREKNLIGVNFLPLYNFDALIESFSLAKL